MQFWLNGGHQVVSGGDLSCNQNCTDNPKVAEDGVRSRQAAHPKRDAKKHVRNQRTMSDKREGKQRKKKMKKQIQSNKQIKSTQNLWRKHHSTLSRKIKVQTGHRPAPPA
jgi:hypothetical protein